MTTLKAEVCSIMAIFRMTISVPGDLKARMDAADKAVGVVWSRVATSAFEDRVRQIEAEQKERTMQSDLDQVAERLRLEASGEAADSMLAGGEAGSQWAKLKAKPKHLRRLSQFSGEYFLSGEPPAPLTLFEAFAAGVDPDVDVDAAVANMVPDEDDRTRYANDRDFCAMFWASALDVWKKVQDKI
ncbi:MAG: hypothetical protein ACK5ZV_11895 [bacterium]